MSRKMDRLSAALQITVLHVDDDAGSRHVVDCVLRQSGFAVIEAATGEEALRRAADVSPHLIILAAPLPDISGLEVCQRLRANPTTSTIPVLYLSATCVGSEDKGRVLASGGDAYLTEPVDTVELLATVRALLRVRHRTVQRGDASALYGNSAELSEGLELPNATASTIIAALSHEFRTPLNSILALTRILLDRIDGQLTPEQDRQVTLIQKAANFLLELGDDMLELTALEARTSRVRPTVFSVSQMFETLQEVFNPLLDRVAVPLIFAEPTPIPPLYTDRVKVTQILRNLICNALKFTAQGEVRVLARTASEGDTVILTVTDTGRGIAPEDQVRVFQKFVRVGVPVQGWRRGVGIGLHLATELAKLLGGRITVQSTPSVGSTFSVIIPRVYRTSVQEAWVPHPDG